MDYYGSNDFRNYIAHHGVKGMKWGVRRYQNYDGTRIPKPVLNDDKVYTKGQTLKSVSRSKRTLTQDKLARGAWALINPTPKALSAAITNNKRWTYTYNPNNEWDAKVYKGPFSVYKTNWGQYGNMYEHTYKIKKDLRMPTREERINGLKEIYEKHPDIVSKDLSTVRGWLKEYEVPAINKHRDKVDLSNIRSKNDWDAAFEIFNHAMEHSYRFASTKKWSKLMSTKYDAMVDDNNQGVTYNDVTDPVIIFNKKMLKEIGDVHVITVDEMMGNFDEVAQKMEATGRKVKL